MKLRWDFVGLLGARGAKLALGLAMMLVYARVFGASATYDAWVWALGVVNATALLLFGPITETIRASYSTIDSRDGRMAAEQYIATVAVLMMAAAILVALVIWAALPPAADKLMPHQSGQTAAATFFLYALAPSLALSQVVAVLTAHLNCNGKVYAPELAGIAGGFIGLIVIVSFPKLSAAWLLIASYYIALVVPLVVSRSFWVELLRALSHIDGPAFRQHAREALTFSMPLFLPYALGQLSGLAERQYALLAGTGALSILSYAFFARSTVQSVFASALSALAVPALARAWNAGDAASFGAALSHWIGQCLMLVTISMIAMFGLSDMAPQLLFGSNIAAEHHLLLAELLRFYAIALIAVILYLAAGSALLAARRGKVYAALGALASLVSLAFLLTLFPLIGIVAIPVGLAVSHALAAALMLHSVAPADTWRFLRAASTRVLAILAAGSMLRGLDKLLLLDLPLLARVAAGSAIAAALGGLWWLVENHMAHAAAPSLRAR